MKVKITQCKVPSYWYSTYIGDVFEVRDEKVKQGDRLKYQVIDDVPLIDVGDCIIVDGVSGKINQFISENGNNTRDALNVALARIEALKAELGFWRGIAMGDDAQDASDELDKKLETGFKREGF